MLTPYIAIARRKKRLDLVDLERIYSHDLSSTSLYRKEYALMKDVLQLSAFIAAFSLPFISLSAYSLEQKHTTHSPPSPWLAFEAGAAFSTTEHNTNTMALPNDDAPSFLYDDYKTNQRDDDYLLGLSGGYEFKLHQSWIRCLLPKARLGLGYEFVGETKVDGQAHVYQEQPYYDYNYKTYSQVGWAIGQLDLPHWRQFTPFIDLGLGISFNHAGEYNEERVNDEVHVRTSADFASHTKTAFAWRAGLGVNYKLHPASPWKVGAVVRYSDLGHVETGDSETYPTVKSLTLPITNLELALQVGYYF